jgi:intein-encoded DNA endonuclease-like protein
MTKYSHDTSFFDVIDTEEKAYFLGLLYADGNVSKKVISISLQEQDKHILDKFKECLKYTGPIISVTKKGNRKQQYKLTITSEPLVVSLSKWGMFPNKGFKLTFPQISPSLYNHFIRGYFDGDGCIYVNPKNYDYLFSIVATKEVLEPLQNILIKELGLNKTKLYNPPKVKGMNLFILTYQGRINVALIKDYLYTNATIYLQRKYEKFMVLSSQI